MTPWSWSVNDSTFDSGSVGIRIWNSHVIVDYVTVIGTRVRCAQMFCMQMALNFVPPPEKRLSLVGTMIDYNTLKQRYLVQLR